MVTSQQYRRRRLLALAVLVVILVGVFFVIRALLAGADKPAASGSPTGSPTPTASPSGSAPPSGSASGSAPASPDPSGTAAVRPCAPESLKVTLSADASTYVIGQAQPTFKVTIANAGQELCLTDGGSKAVTITVVTGEDRVFSSTDCTANAVSRPLLMEPGVSDDRHTATWNLRRSATGCPDPAAQPVVGPGTYSATATVGGTSSPAVVFTLTAPAPAPEENSTPSAG